MKVYVVNGKAGAGKTTFEDFVIAKMGVYAMRVSTISFVKEIAKQCDWDGEKTPKSRKFLSDLKDLLTEWNDIPFKRVQQKIQSYLMTFEQFGIGTEKVVIFIDCREPSEIDKIKKYYDGKAVCIMRKIDGYNPSNHADADVDNYKYDIYIENDSDLKNLYHMAEKFMEMEHLI